MAWQNLETAHGMIAAEAPAAARVSFVRKTYFHLGGAVLAFIAIEAALLGSPLAAPIVRTFLGGRMSWLVVLGAFMLVGWVAERWARSAAVMVAVAAGYILYYTSNVLHHYPIGAHVSAALALFAAVALLFWYLLQLLMHRR